MNRLTILLLFCLMFSTSVSAQKQGRALVDSLLRELPNGKNDTNKVTLLNKISIAYQPVNMDSAMVFCSASLDLSHELNWVPGCVDALNSFTTWHLRKSDYKKALETGAQSLKLAEQNNLKKRMIAPLNNMAICYQQLENLPLALEYQLKCLKIAEEINSPAIPIITSNIGGTYQNLKNYTKALEYDFKALKMDEAINNKTNSCFCMNNIGFAYFSLGKYAQSLEYSLKANKGFQELGDKLNGIISLRNIGRAYRAQHDYVNAFKYEFAALKGSEELNNKNLITNANLDLGIIYLQIAKDTVTHLPKDNHIPSGTNASLKLAIEYLEKSRLMAGENNLPRELQETNEKLKEAYELIGDNKAALESYKVYSKMKDSVYSIENNIKVSKLETARALELKDKQIIIDKLEVEKKRNERIFYLAGIVFLLIVMILIVRNYRKQIVTNRLLKEEKIRSDGLMTDLKASLQQKEILMKEIHHRVKNNLQVITSLLDLQVAAVSDEAAKGAMGESTTRVKSISLIHQQLYQNEDMTAIEIAKFTGDLMNLVTSVLKRDGLQLFFDNDIAERLIDIDTAVPLGLILNELMTNSYKYAFTGSEGRVKISLREMGGYYELTYTDNGPGLPAGFDINNKPSSKILK